MRIIQCVIMNILLFGVCLTTEAQEFIIGVTSEKHISKQDPFHSLTALFLLKIKSDSVSDTKLIHLSSESWSTLLCCETDTTDNNLYDRIFNLKANLGSDSFEVINSKYQLQFKELEKDFIKMTNKGKRLEYKGKYVFIGSSTAHFCDCTHIYKNTDSVNVLSLKNIYKFNRVSRRQIKIIKQTLPSAIRKMQLDFIFQ